MLETPIAPSSSFADRHLRCVLIHCVSLEFTQANPWRILIMRKVSSFCTSMISMFSLFLLFGAVAAQAQENPTTSTTATQNVAPQAASEEKPPLFITFVPINRGIGPSPQATFGCSIPYPTATETFSSRTATWSGSVSCSISVGLYGTTKFFNYNTNVVLASGSQINTTATSATSSGSYVGVPSGTYEVNFNIQITPPAGYTTTPGAGCAYVGSGPAILCTVGSGTFTQP
jgi:hypothetical protein